MHRKEFLKRLGATSMIIPLFNNCSDSEPTPVPVVTGFSPGSGAVGTTVTITGLNFSITASENSVMFNGVAATILTSTNTIVTVSVPQGASTGKITVTVGNNTATSTNDFTVEETSSSSLSITSFSPSSAVAGSTIIVTGANFSTSTSSNIVIINGIAAEVTAATSTQLTVIVPQGATSGPISVTVNGVTVTTATSFIVGVSSASCVTTASETAGPFPTKEPSTLVRQDIRADRTGVALSITIAIQNKNNSCAPLEGAIVDIWHCDKDGYYSEYGGTTMQSINYTTVHFLRGRQVTDSNGIAGFTSIFPGWYTSRATHIHVHIYDATGKSILVTQIGFPEGTNSAVALVNASTANGYTKGMSGYTYNANDNVFTDSTATEIAAVSGSVGNGYALTHTIVASA